MPVLLFSWGYCAKRENVWKKGLFSMRCHMCSILRVFTLLGKFLHFCESLIFKRILCEVFLQLKTALEKKLHGLLYFCGQVFLHISPCYPTFTHINPHTHNFHADFRKMFVISILRIKTRKKREGVISGRRQ